MSRGVRVDSDLRRHQQGASREQIDRQLAGFDLFGDCDIPDVEAPPAAKPAAAPKAVRLHGTRSSESTPTRLGTPSLATSDSLAASSMIPNSVDARLGSKALLGHGVGGGLF